MMNWMWVMLAAVGCFFMVGMIGNYYLKLTKPAIGFLVAGCVLVAWGTTAAIAPSVCIDVSYHPVSIVKCPDGAEVDMATIEGRQINLNRELGIRVPVGCDTICRMQYQKSWLGLHMSRPSKYKLVTD